jgi:hypothetical protein
MCGTEKREEIFTKTYIKILIMTALYHKEILIKQI